MGLFSRHFLKTVFINHTVSKLINKSETNIIITFISLFPTDDLKFSVEFKMFDFAKPNSLFTQMCISFFRDDLDVESGKSQSKKKKKENKTKEKKHIEQSQQLQVFTLGIPQKKTTSSFVEDKLQKKLKKLKQRKENTERGKEIACRINKIAYRYLFFLAKLEQCQTRFKPVIQI